MSTNFCKISFLKYKQSVVKITGKIFYCLSLRVVDLLESVR